MRVVPVLLLLAACTTVPPESAPSGVDVPADASAASLRELALVAYQAGDLDRFVALQEKAVQADPERTVDRYNLACGYARTGQRDAALRELRTLLELGIDYGAAEDSDFSTLAEDPEFQQIVMALDALHPVVHQSSRYADLGDRDALAPEGIAYEGSTGRTFVSTMRTGEIWVLDDAGENPQRFTTLEVDGVPLSGFGLQVDEVRGVLWAVGSAFSLHHRYEDAHAHTTGLFGYDLATGERVATHTLVGGPAGGFNDLAVAEDGTVIVSGGALYVLRPNAERIEPLTVTPPFESSSGLTFGVDSDVLYVAANRKGIARVDVRAGHWDWVDGPKGQDLRQVDALEWADGSLVAIQLGMRRWRAARLDLDAGGATIKSVTVLEQGHPDIAFATQGTLIGDTFRFVSRAPLPAGTDRGAVGPAAGRTVLWEVPVWPVVSDAP